MLAVTETHLRAVLDSIPARVVLIDRDQRFLYANQNYIDFVGLPADAIIGHTVAELLGPDVYATLRPTIDQALLGKTVRWEGWLHYLQGLRYVQRVYVPYRTESGDVDGYFSFSRDLTDLKRSEALNAAITASALDCIIAIDETGAVVEFNPAAEQTFGYRRPDVIGRPIGELIVPPALRQRHGEGLLRYLRTGETTVLGRRIEIEAMRSDGSTFPVELSINEVRLQERRLFTAYLRDLTPARQAAGEIQRQREALHQSEKLAAFGSLLAGVAHELNNPLSIVIGNALMLQEEAETVSPSLAERAQRIQASAERCGRIVRSFLAMARQREALKRTATVQSLIDNALQLLAYGLRTSGVEVEQAISPGIPAVLCDPDQINQVLTNMLINARQVLEEQPPPRHIRISVTADADEVAIAVADNGPGIPEDIRSRVFDPFFTTKPTGSGTGIGLAVSRGIVKAHGGSLTLVDTDCGACFVMRLPLRAIEAGTPEPPASGIGAPIATEACTALIMDDEPEVGRILSEMMTAQGFQCVVVTSGQDAQERLGQRDYDAIICDVRLPGIDGPALFAWMTSHKPHLCARTAFVTGDTLGPAAGRFLAGAGRPLLEKPFVPAEVRRLIAELVPDGHN